MDLVISTQFYLLEDSALISEGTVHPRYALSCWLFPLMMASHPL